jgi:hypothetical protein
VTVTFFALQFSKGMCAEPATGADSGSWPVVGGLLVGTVCVVDGPLPPVREGTVGVGSAGGAGTSVLGIGRDSPPGTTGVGPGVGISGLGASGGLGAEPAMRIGRVTLPPMTNR